MNRLLSQGILASLQVADTTTGLQLLEENRAFFLDPLEGVKLQAEGLYYAIKTGNVEIARFLLNLPISSDVAFFRFCGHTPLSLAIEEERRELFPLLLAKTDKDFALHMAFKLNLSKTKNFLLNHCAFRERLLHFLGVPA